MVERIGGEVHMPTIAIFQPDSRASARLRDVLTGDYELRLVDTWAELSSVLVTTQVSACIVDIYAPGMAVPPDRLGRLRKRRPDMAIVVYSDFSRNPLDPFEPGKHGIDAVIDAGDDNPDTIRDALTRSHASVHRLARQLRSMDAPPARVILVWGRLLHAARLLQWNRTAESVAHESGYASASALGRAFRFRVGFPPGDVSDRGSLTPILGALLESPELRRLRENQSVRTRAASG